MAEASYKPKWRLSSDASVSKNKQFMNSLICSTPAEQKLMLSELLFPSIHSMYPELSKRVASIMFHICHQSELFHMLNCHQFFKMRLDEVLTLIKLCENHLGFSSDLPRSVLVERQPLNKLLKNQLLSLVRNLCPENAEAVTLKLSNLENSVILHLLHCYDCLNVRVIETQTTLLLGQLKQPLCTKDSLESIDQTIEMPEERHLLGDDLFSTIQGENSTSMTITAEQRQTVLIEGQGGRIFSELRSVPLTLKVQNKILLKQLAPLIKGLYPNYSLELISAIRGIDNSELVHMLWCRNFLLSKLEEILCLLRISHEPLFQETSLISPTSLCWIGVFKKNFLYTFWPKYINTDTFFI